MQKDEIRMVALRARGIPDFPPQGWGLAGSDETNLRAARRPSTLASGGLRFEFRNPRLERSRVRFDFRLGEARGERDWEWGDGR
jgi:hypothetical protein